MHSQAFIPRTAVKCSVCHHVLWPCCLDDKNASHRTVYCLKTIYFKISSAWHVTCSYNLKQALLKYCIPTWSKFTIYKKHNHNPFFVLLLLLKNILRWKHTLFKMRGRFWCHIYLYIYECIYHEAQNAVIITPPSRCKYMLTPSHSPAFCVMQTHTQAHKSQRKHSFPHTHT